MDRITSLRSTPPTPVSFPTLTMLAKNAIASTTANSYCPKLKAFEKFCEKFNYEACPASIEALRHFVEALFLQGKTLTYVESSLAAIHHWHRSVGLDAPTKDSLVLAAKKGWKRLNAKPKKVRKPITPSILRKLIKVFLHKKETNLIYWRTVWRIIMEFYGGLRWADISELRTNHITFEDNYMTLQLPKMKNDQFREGNSVHFYKAIDERYCPVTVTRHYLDLLRKIGKFPIYLQPRLQHTSSSQKGHVLADPHQFLSYRQALKDSRHLLTSIGLDSKNYGEHSGKKGGITWAALNNASRTELTAVGKWKSDKMIETYVSRTPEFHQKVQQKLDISKQKSRKKFKNSFKNY